MLFSKPQKSNTYPVELEVQEIMDLLEEVKREIRKIQAELTDVSVKASISHSLLVVRKIAENKLDDLNSLLD